MLLCAAFVFVAYDKKDKEGFGEITLLGTVIDGSTGDPLQNTQTGEYCAYTSAEQQIEGGNNGSSMGAVGPTVTGSDGSYEFTIYNISTDGRNDALVEKDGYKYQVYEGINFENVMEGGRVKVDFKLRKEK